MISSVSVMCSRMCIAWSTRKINRYSLNPAWRVDNWIPETNIRTEERLISSRKLVAGKRPAFLSTPIADSRSNEHHSIRFESTCRQIRFRSINLEGRARALIYESNLIDAHTIYRRCICICCCSLRASRSLWYLLKWFCYLYGGFTMVLLIRYCSSEWNTILLFLNCILYRSRYLFIISYRK